MVPAYNDIMLLDFLYWPVPLWGALCLFLIGAIIGYLVRKKHDGSDQIAQVRLEAFIQVAVFLLWTAATARAVFYDNVEYPPLFLNLLFGAVFGSLNKRIGDYLISIATAFKK